MTSAQFDPFDARMAATAAIPVLDASLSDAELVPAVRDACRSFGFFVLTRHGCEEAQGDALRQSACLFSLPEDVKQSLAASPATNNRGWTRLGEETLDPSSQSRGDTKEGYYIGREVPADSPEALLPLHGPNVWPPPALVPEFRPAMEGYMEKGVALARRVVRLLALALDLPGEYFDAPGMFDKPQVFLRPLRYSSEVSDPARGIFGAGAHSDYGMVTLLCTDGTPGLQIQPRAGRGDDGSVADEDAPWVDAPTIPDALIVNLGDMCERWSNGQFVSTRHRVLNVTGKQRLSLPLFFEPNFGCVVECLPSCLDETSGARYPPVTAGEYLLGRYAATHEAYKAPTEPSKAETDTSIAQASAPRRHILRDARPSDEAELAALYAAALDYNPAFRAVFELDDPASHAQALHWLFHRRVALLFASRAHYLVAVDEQSGALLEGAAIVPRANKAGLLDMLRVGLLEWPFRFGLPSLVRALSRDSLPEDPPGVAPYQGMVSTVAVLPEAQGRGIGSAVMTALLERWDAGGGGPLVLDTQRERNVEFYQRLGFRLTAKVSTPGAHGMPYDDWKMRREAAQQ